MPTVRLLSATDAAAYRELRLDALRRHPCAFRAHHDEEAGQDLAAFAARLEADAIFGGFCDGRLCGLAGLEIPQARNKRHKGVLFGVYVCPERRRAGLGAALVGVVIEHARGRVEQLHAAVVVTADPARALYRRLGFLPYGLEPRALKVGRKYFDQELLVLPLGGRPLRPDPGRNLYAARGWWPGPGRRRRLAPGRAPRFGAFAGAGLTSAAGLAFGASIGEPPLPPLPLRPAGLTPSTIRGCLIRRSMPRSWPRSDASHKDSATPAAPARAVRPIRCT